KCLRAVVLFFPSGDGHAPLYEFGESGTDNCGGLHATVLLRQCDEQLLEVEEGDFGLLDAEVELVVARPILAGKGLPTPEHVAGVLRVGRSNAGELRGELRGRNTFPLGVRLEEVTN